MRERGLEHQGGVYRRISRLIPASAAGIIRVRMYIEKEAAKVFSTKSKLKKEGF